MLPKPGDPEGAAIWSNRDLIAKSLIANSIANEQTIHVAHYPTLFQMWTNLQTAHKLKSQQLLVDLKGSMYAERPSEGVNILVYSWTL